GTAKCISAVPASSVLPGERVITVFVAERRRTTTSAGSGMVSVRDLTLCTVQRMDGWLPAKRGAGPVRRGSWGLARGVSTRWSLGTATAGISLFTTSGSKARPAMAAMLSRSVMTCVRPPMGADIGHLLGESNGCNGSVPYTEYIRKGPV